MSRIDFAVHVKMYDKLQKSNGLFLAGTDPACD
jgi:hypothetical protein